MGILICDLYCDSSGGPPRASRRYAGLHETGGPRSQQVRRDGMAYLRLRIPAQPRRDRGTLELPGRLAAPGLHCKSAGEGGGAVQTLPRD